MSEFICKHCISVNEAYEKFQKARAEIGDETIILELQNYFDMDTFTWFLESLDDDYNLNLFDDVNEKGGV